MRDVNLELAWAAGFFDGEGNVARTHRWTPTLTVTNTDLELLGRFHAAVGERGSLISKPNHPRVATGHRKPIFNWYASAAKAVAVAELLLPLAGSRNRGRFERAIAIHAEGKNGVCERCGDPFKRQVGTARFCSKRCSSAARRVANAVRMPCPICGNPFDRLYPETQTCSKRCAAALPNRQQVFRRAMQGTPNPFGSEPTSGL